MTLVLDVHVAAAVAEQLRRRGMDVVTVPQWLGASDVSDDLILTEARAAGRVLVTYDSGTVPDLLRRWATEGEPHAGVVFIHSRTLAQDDIGGQVRALMALVDQLGAEDWTNKVHHLRRA